MNKIMIKRIFPAVFLFLNPAPALQNAAAQEVPADEAPAAAAETPSAPAKDAPSDEAAAREFPAWTVREVKEDAAGVQTIPERAGAGEVTVRSKTAPGAEDLEIIFRTLESMVNMPGLKIKSISVIYETPLNFRFAVFPESFVYNGEDLAEHIPAGLAFYFRNSLFYDITIKAGALVPKVRGLFVSGEGLCRHIALAIESPERYMYDETLLARVRRLENSVMALIKKSAPKENISRELVFAVLNTYNENNALTPAECAALLKAKGFKTNEKEVRAVYMVFINDVK